ncbi:hypothetical protein GSS88_00295 [Corynebacterium sp. 3HC-13]|uniref:hypothetical protein n=1 Tax=Corynebacterium poyangense TaxID=2684405 RepID=UPI001CCEF8FB|nr:hypothetical protein [Corynebacterium poyangense]MBZ8176248.1 hypothetical protein [Corynebacterium poyangense]
MPTSRFAGFYRIIRIITVQQIRSLSTYVFLGCALLMALSAVLTTVYRQEIMSALVDPTLASTLSDQMPAASWPESYTAWVKNLNQILVLGGVIVVSISAQRDFRSGSLAFLLSRFLSRPAFALAHFLVSTITFLIIFLIGAFLAGVITTLFFDNSPLLPIMGATMLWGFIFSLISAAIYCATGIKRSLGLNIITGLGLYFLFQLGGMWTWAKTHTPFGLSDIAHHLATDTTTDSSFLPIVSSLLLLVIFIFASLYSFSRAELPLD